MNINYIGLQTFVSQELLRIKRVWIQTLVTPWVSALLYILIFGQIVGRRIGAISGISYIDFVVPGLLMMNVINGAFSGTSFGLYLHRFQNAIQEVLVAPLSYFEMGIGFVAAGALRGILTGLGVFFIAIFFTSASIAHFWQFLFFLIATSLLFSSLGAVIGMWAQNFEQINLPQIFILLPMSFLGGVFHSTALLPEPYATISKLNPIFYMINGIRGSMIGVSDTNPLTASIVIIVLTALSFTLCVKLFNRGYHLRT